MLDLKNKSADIIFLINKYLTYNLISNTFFYNQAHAYFLYTNELFKKGR